MRWIVGGEAAVAGGVVSRWGACGGREGVVVLPGVLFSVGGDTIRLTFPARHLTVENLDDLHDFRGNFRGNFRGKESQGGATVASSDPRGRPSGSIPASAVRVRDLQFPRVSPGSS